MQMVGIIPVADFGRPKSLARGRPCGAITARIDAGLPGLRAHDGGALR